MGVRRIATSQITKQNKSSLFSNLPLDELKWARVGNVPSGSVTTGLYNQQNVDYYYWKFLTTGSVTFSQGGFVDVMVVGGGGDSGGGAVSWKLVEVADNETITVTIGAGGTYGGTSGFGSLCRSGGGMKFISGEQNGVSGNGGGGGQGGNGSTGGGSGGTVWGVATTSGTTLNYDNNQSIEYGIGASNGAINTGNAPQGSGVVIFRSRK